MADSDEKMRELLGRIAKLEETVENLRQLVEGIAKARRDGMLWEVDRLEILQSLPRTAELRKKSRAA